MRYQAIYQPITGKFEVVRFTPSQCGLIGKVLFSVLTLKEAQAIIRELSWTTKE